MTARPVRTGLYIAGPMSGIPGWNFPEFNRVEAALREAGYRVVNPAAKGLQEDWTWSDYLCVAIGELLTCAGLATLDGWDKSRGARFEVRVAEGLGMPVWHWTDWPVTGAKT